MYAVKLKALRRNFDKLEFEGYLSRHTKFQIKKKWPLTKACDSAEARHIYYDSSHPRISRTEPHAAQNLTRPCSTPFYHSDSKQAAVRQPLHHPTNRV